MLNIANKESIDSNMKYQVVDEERKIESDVVRRLLPVRDTAIFVSGTWQTVFCWSIL